MNSQYAVIIGLDVGKSAHHACALDAAGNRVYDKPLTQDESELRDLFTSLQQRGPALTEFVKVDEATGSQAAGW